MSSGEVEQISHQKGKAKISLHDENSAHLWESPNEPNYTEKCIQHCSLFPPDYEFEKDKLIQMWISEECVDMEMTTRSIEDVANDHFQKLVHEELIVVSGFDNLYEKKKYKVNQSKAAAFFDFKSGNYLRINEDALDEIPEGVVHLSLQFSKFNRTIIDGTKNLKHLRTLLLLGYTEKQLPDDIFNGLKLLRTLDLSYSYVSELPDSFGDLESLRFLDVSGTPIKELPVSTDSLNFLQTLNLRGCSSLRALPAYFRKLVNLRHLDLDIVRRLKSMPKGMGNLTKIQTLSAFLVGKNDGCRIVELKNMNNIAGSFCISRLENVSNAEEAKEAALINKKHIIDLELVWRENRDCDAEVEILENLQPHFGLKELQIVFYCGSKLPSWIDNPSYTNLTNITLYGCINCRILPSLGELPSLKILSIYKMNTVKDINSLFCRNYATQYCNAAFPSLEKLILDGMLNLEAWSGTENGDFPCLFRLSIKNCSKLSIIPSMHQLRSLKHLELSNCAQLISFPKGGLPNSLETLIVKDCLVLSQQCVEDGGQDYVKHVRDIWIDFQKIVL